LQASQTNPITPLLAFMETPIERGATPEAPMSRNLTAIIVTIACSIAAGLLLGLIIFLVFKLTGVLRGL
jgi:xanthine/uracil/vitamin C permease (AzgA family)